MYIFGKFEAFCKRIQKVVDMFNVIEKFSKLEALGIEGMDMIVKKFLSIMNQMQRKPYDILDHRKMVLLMVVVFVASSLNKDCRNTTPTTPVSRSRY
jgi:hypothetical protein